MARQTTITDDRILEAARAIFLEEGFSAPTARIAQRAGVSEGTIFKRFPTKEALFFAAMDIEYPPAWHATLDRLAGTGDFRENLVTVCTEIQIFFLEATPRNVMKLGSRRREPERDPFHGMEDPPPVRDARKIAGFLQKEMGLGRMRACNTQILAEALLGALIHQSFLTMAVTSSLAHTDPVDFARQVVDLLWHGIEPAQG